MKQKKRSILLIITVIALMLIIIFFVGRSFGFFQYIKKGENVNIITINGIVTQVINSENDALNLENAYPITDSEGLSLDPFEFLMTNTSSRDIAYTIKVEVDSDKMAACVLDDQTLCPELSTDYIKYTYKKDDGTYTEPKILGENDNIIATGIIAGKEEITSSIILWIDSDAGNEIMNHYFYGKIIITGEPVSD